MFSFLKYYFLCLLLVYTGNAPSQNDPSKEFLAVKEFIIRGDCSFPAKVLTENFRSELSKSNKFQVMKTEKMQSILKKNGIQEGWQCQTKECLIAKGELLGVDAMVFGTIVKLRADFIVIVRKININTAELSRFYCAHGKGEENIKSSLTQIVKEFCADKKFPEPETTKKKVIIIGSSFRRGIAGFVIRDLKEQCTLWWPIESGGSSSKILKNIDSWILTKNPDIVNINCGNHDLRRDKKTKSYYTPIEKYRENMRSILQQIREKTKARIIVSNITPVNEERHNKVKPFYRFNKDIKDYNKVLSEICKEMGVHLQDINTLINSIGRDKYMLPDGIHYNDEGA